MRRTLRVSSVALLLALTATVFGAIGDVYPVHAQGTSKGASGLPLPRFVSLKSRRVNIRIGPSTDYAVAWMYLKEGLPMEIIQEYDNWRRVRDADGTEGWVNQALLSGERTAVAAPWMKGKGKDIFVNMRREPQTSAAIAARLEPGVIVRIKECNGTWCRAEAGSAEGWVSQSEIWGAYPGEAFK
ncbi:SH3 domain-containing protein [Rhizobium sp. SSA_523]|uniref:SH3 domain-containing protein n=1 Tax=Rhizobium sp. SSA_523 TaxID=2952477 RepID=UPI002090FD3A|nr:SH3 domain-containing protein [Rhizobium sp. SSA_523]MCO5732866.1 SH3 domain-containing protein [Rhizobium sp. SSA_523]WKC23517.1 SH3 domain-containing protein [Rhizobium sp. SSA_523]